MTLVWFIAFIILLFVELITVNLVTIWFAIGAIASMITSIFVDSIVIQVIVFIVLSLVTLIATKPIMRKFKKFDVIPTNSDRVIGKIGDVIKDIKKNEYGEVKVYGNVWTATSDEEIPIGSKVKVISIDGVKLIVKKEED